MASSQNDDMSAECLKLKIEEHKKAIRVLEAREKVARKKAAREKAENYAASARNEACKAKESVERIKEEVTNLNKVVENATKVVTDAEAERKRSNKAAAGAKDVLMKVTERVDKAVIAAREANAAKIQADKEAQLAKIALKQARDAVTKAEISMETKRIAAEKAEEVKRDFELRASAAKSRMSTAQSAWDSAISTAQSARDTAMNAEKQKKAAKFKIAMLNKKLADALESSKTADERLNKALSSLMTWQSGKGSSSNCCSSVGGSSEDDDNEDDDSEDDDSDGSVDSDDDDSSYDDDSEDDDSEDDDSEDDDSEDDDSDDDDSDDDDSSDDDSSDDDSSDDDNSEGHEKTASGKRKCGKFTVTELDNLALFIEANPRTQGDGSRSYFKSGPPRVIWPKAPKNTSSNEWRKVSVINKVGRKIKICQNQASRMNKEDPKWAEKRVRALKADSATGKRKRELKNEVDQATSGSNQDRSKRAKRTCKGRSPHCLKASASSSSSLSSFSNDFHSDDRDDDRDCSNPKEPERVGEVVWAKVTGYPHWPARVATYAEIICKNKDKHADVSWESASKCDDTTNKVRKKCKDLIRSGKVFVCFWPYADYSWVKNAFEFGQNVKFKGDAACRKKMSRKQKNDLKQATLEAQNYIQFPEERKMGRDSNTMIQWQNDTKKHR